MDELITIPAHPHLAEWMKETNIMGKAFRGELGEISEWAARKALWDWPVGTQVTLQELTDRAFPNASTVMFFSELFSMSSRVMD